MLGQSGVVVRPDLRAVAFALFILALGFTAGPQFFTNLRNGWRYGILSFVEVVTVVALIAIAVMVLIRDNEILLIFGRRKAVIAAQERLGDEVPLPPEINLPIVSRDVVLDRREAIGQKIGTLRHLVAHASS